VIENEDKTYLLKWYGPFPSQEGEQKWELEHDELTFNLYLIYGQKKYAKTKEHYYVGQTANQKVFQRFKNAGHHINDYSRKKEIWIGSFSNISPQKEDINLAEKMLTSYLGYNDEIHEKSILNKTNLYAPNKSVYIINRWYNAHNLEWQRHRISSPARIIADVIVYKCDDKNDCVMYEAKKLKKKW